jgi:pimeloyl-ACP methyl ester carboxylesterase
MELYIKVIYRRQARRNLIFILFLLACHTLVLAQKFQPQYDESKVPGYTLPNVLKTNQNKRVRNKKDWENSRRAEVLKLFEDNIYGQMPRQFDSVKFSIINEDRTSMEGKAHLKEVAIQVFRQGKSVTMNLLLFVPNNIPLPVPAFLLINNRSKDNMDPTRKTKSEFWPAEMVIDSGYAVAAFHVGDLAPDDKDQFMNGVLQLYPEQLNADNGMRAIGAWGWGASRVMDYFERDRAIDDEKIVLVGHSRGGKASLWAAAQDQRFAICVTNCSGNTGAALSRRQFGERISAINEAFPHWFNNNYKNFNSNENNLPVDQHMLIALIAPRPVYATNASEDLWADPTGTFLALKHAEPVYALYDLKSALPTAPPAIDQAIIRSPLAYHNREGIHNLTLYDWTNFVKFARYHFKTIR